MILQSEWVAVGVFGIRALTPDQSVSVFIKAEHTPKSGL